MNWIKTHAAYYPDERVLWINKCWAITLCSEKCGGHLYLYHKNQKNPDIYKPNKIDGTCWVIHERGGLSTYDRVFPRYIVSKACHLFKMKRLF